MITKCQCFFVFLLWFGACRFYSHDDVIWHDDIFRVTDHLCEEYTGHRWIPLTKASNAELWCFLWTNGWVNNRDAGDLRRHRAHYDVTLMVSQGQFRHSRHSHICLNVNETTLINGTSITWITRSWCYDDHKTKHNHTGYVIHRMHSAWWRMSLAIVAV